MNVAHPTDVVALLSKMIFRELANSLI